MTGIEEAAALGAGATAVSSTAAAAGTTAALTVGGAVGAAATNALAASTGAGLLGTLGAVSPYLTLGSTLLSAAGALSAGNAQSATMKANAAAAKVNAGTALSTSEADVARLQDRARRQVATGTNTYGASGVNLGSGSPLDVLADQAAQGALDGEIARWRGQTSSDAYLRQSAQDTSQADQASAAGELQAGSTLLTAGARYATSKLPRSLSKTGFSL